MHRRTPTSRRQALQLLAGMPMLPLASSLAGASPPAAADPRISRTRFTAMAAPSLANPAEMATISVKAGLEATLADGSRRAWKLFHYTFSDFTFRHM